ncbi:hypothetical protein B0T26DRAFT_809863 [Lasiosphaeria miniovina]|uniref:Uncharacterized protein n=1 Tax=Lasiosphaeria miniovina TaxID=1954250 RepID=A0AA40B4Y3_9PEZI|nr:uncharacterized protein B0T26DRAFT_809863 [Lasiosphaeria miniovina]KAK0727448.1 hypothetical protein B0T26DRAFT_809863 [Lasiosphaeria miniovina]
MHVAAGHQNHPLPVPVIRVPSMQIYSRIQPPQPPSFRTRHEPVNPNPPARQMKWVHIPLLDIGVVVGGSGSGSGSSGQQTSSLASSPSPATHELVRYTKIVRRLQWKLPFLATGYYQAVARGGAKDPAAQQAQAAVVQAAEAELMFKLDFFEYYMLIERALVHLLGVFGITISRGGISVPPRAPSKGLSSSVWGGNGRNSRSTDDRMDNNRASHAPNSGGYPGSASNNHSGQGSPGPWGHRYHANVLEALDDKENPLHEVLGTGEVRRQLGRAKDLRNRWKTAGDDVDTMKVSVPLEVYDLDRMLTTVFEGFDAAFVIAERFVGGDSEGDEGDDSMDIVSDGGGDGGGGVDWTATDEEQWEFMVDAMDWEAV